MAAVRIPKGRILTTSSGVSLHGSGSGASGYSNFKFNYPMFADAGCRAIVPGLTACRGSCFALQSDCGH